MDRSRLIRRGFCGPVLLATLGALVLTGCGEGSSSAASRARGAAIATGTAQSRSATVAANEHSGSTAPAPAVKTAREVSAGASPSASTGVPYTVHTTSMEPSYRYGSTVYYDPTRTHPQIGDVILFYLPVGGKHGSCGAVMEGKQACARAKPGLTRTLAIKRVVGLPGDTIAIRAGRVIRNGEAEPEPSTIHCKPGEQGCEFPTTITVPAGTYYVMSDNRQLFEEDSRVWGALPQAAIVGTVERG